MKKISIGSYELEFEDSLVKRFELKTHNDFEACAIGFIKAGFSLSNVSEICEKHTAEEIKSVIIQYTEADLLMFPE